MALLTDAIPNTAENLRAYETEILSLANVEMIDLNTKLRLALEEVSFAVLAILLDHARATDPLASVRRTIGVSDVVVSPQMKRWHALHSLELVYRDAYNNQLNDRYQVKWQEYQDLSEEARDQTVGYGIGLASVPIPAAATPTLSSITGTNPSAVYYASISWVGANGQVGSPSALNAFQTPDGSFLVVQPPVAPATATGWNVYVGLTERGVTLQNSSPLTLGQSFTLGALVAGVAPGDGQAADIWVTGGRPLRRG